jgi:hypothetical protein
MTLLFEMCVKDREVSIILQHKYNYLKNIKFACAIATLSVRLKTESGCGRAISGR